MRHLSDAFESSGFAAASAGGKAKAGQVGRVNPLSQGS
jgi:hypothetical protein